MMNAKNRVTEPYLVALAKWHLYRKRRVPEHYRTMWAFRKYVQWCQPGGILIDCGANVGDVTGMLLRKKFTVHAFEPDPVAAAALTRRYIGYPSLTIHRAAVGASSRRALLHRPASDDIAMTPDSSLFHRGESHTRADEVDVIDLVDFIAKLKRRIQILKLDVEGAEFEILEKMLDEGTWQAVDHIFVESHERFSADFEQRLAAIRRRIAAEGITNIRFGWV